MSQASSISSLEKSKSWQLPDTLILIFIIGIFAAAATYFIPAGTFESQDVSFIVDGAEKTRTVIDPASLVTQPMKTVSLSTTRLASLRLVAVLA